VLDAFRADRSTEARATIAEAFNDFPSPMYLLVDEVPGGVLAVENNGWWGVDADVVAAASRTGIAFDESWLVERHSRFEVPSPV